MTAFLTLDNANGNVQYLGWKSLQKGKVTNTLQLSSTTCDSDRVV